MTVLPHRIAPDFCIVGAPKAGTTALARYLTQHPGISMASVKEPHFWSSDLRVPGQVCTGAEYRRLWDGARPGTLWGEASTSYIRSICAIPNLRSVRPEARFILLLRKPSEMAYAWHGELRLSFQENVGSFEHAWRLQEERAAGRRVPPECVSPDLLQYRRICAIGEQLERFYSWVPDEHRLVLLYDEFSADPGECYKRVLSFLGLPQDGRSEFPRLRTHQDRGPASLINFHRSLPRLMGPFYPSVRALAAKIGLRPSALVNRLTLRTRPRRPLDPEFEELLVRSFLEEVEKVEALLGRALPRWKAPSHRV
jgi:hypothetical protein